MPTLNYDPTEADQPEFNEAEKEALAIGERAYEQEQQLLAGKFEDAEALEKAYIELQRKLGSGEREEQASPEPQQEEEPEDPILALIDEARTSDEFDLDKFKDLDPTEVAKTFLENTSEDGPGRDLNDKEVDSIRNSVGGEEAYGQLMEWANEQYPEQVIQAFDSLVDSGNALAIQLAVNGLMADYEANNGLDGTLLTGKGAPPAKADVFRSQAEVVRAMNDPKYDADPAYRQDVFDKLSRSNLDTY